MLRKERQKGMTFLGYVIVLGIIGFFAIMAMKLTPLYLEYQSVVKILEGVSEEYGPTASPAALRSTIQKRLDVNNIDRISSKDFDIRRDKGTTVVEINYEARTKFAGNLWFLLQFDHAVSLQGS